MNLDVAITSARRVPICTYCEQQLRASWVGVKDLGSSVRNSGELGRNSGTGFLWLPHLKAGDHVHIFMQFKGYVIDTCNRNKPISGTILYGFLARGVVPNVVIPPVGALK